MQLSSDLFNHDSYDNMLWLQMEEVMEYGAEGGGDGGQENKYRLTGTIIFTFIY